MRRRVIVCADDLGLSPEVNAGIEQAHRDGVLTAASLMVGERAATEGVAVARRNPRLAVGLHLTLTDGTPTLPPERIPALVRPDGRFRDDMAGFGLSLAVSADARAQLRAEIAAQFAALLRRLAARHGLRSAERVVGVAWSGAFTADRLAAILPLLPNGTTELYLHPATDGFPGSASGYRYAEELAALTDPRVRAAAAQMAIGGYTATLGA